MFSTNFINHIHIKLIYIFYDINDSIILFIIDTVTHLKDLILITLLLGASIGFWYAYNQNKSSTQHLKRMMRDMESLQKAETALEDLQV